MSRAIPVEHAPLGERRRRTDDRGQVRPVVASPLSVVASLPARLALVGLAIFALALVPRLLGRDLFPTSDEDSWMRRTGGFTYGLMTDQLGRTYQNGHPGVTTMWIAMLSQQPSGAIRFADRVHGMRFVAQVPGYLEALAQSRVGFAVVASIGVATSMFLLWRLFGPLPALLAGAFLALEPFLVANSQLVHVDGLLATFMTVSVLAALVRWRAGGGRRYLALSAVTAGLALLTKSPAVFLVLFVPILAVLSRVSILRAHGVPPPHRAPQHSDLALWTALCFGTFVALWPALWALGPIEVLGRMIDFARETGGQPDEVGSFFLGQVGADPGPLYYPVAALFRLSPAVLLGLVALLALGFGLPADVRARVGWLTLFVIGFGAMMTLGPKKFDRYLLPIFPALAAMAALGWALVIEPIRNAALRASAAATLIIVAAWSLLSIQPYSLAYYNPLLGGGPAAQRSVMIGNGEGMDQAGRWIAAQPDAANLWVAAHSFDILAALIPGQGEPLRDGVPSDADYIVTYGRRIQMQRWGQSLERYFQDNPPTFAVWINGIEYARIHPGPRRSRQS